MIGNANRHPERKRRICTRDEKAGKTSAEVTDSSLCVAVLFPHLSHKEFLLPFRMTIREKSVTNNGERKVS